MKREIKFRAWDGQSMLSFDTHEWLLFSATGYQAFETEQDGPKGGDESYTNSLEAMAWELMQYTGLKDKNGVEIYEGDIVSEPCHDCENGVMISEIVFERGAFSKKGGFCGCMTHTTLYGEVIGNIHEPHKLLEQS